MSMCVDGCSSCPCTVSCGEWNCRERAGGPRESGYASPTGVTLARRTLLKGALAAGLPVSFMHTSLAQEARMARPDKGDLLVYASGEKAREVITLADFPVGGPPAIAWPMDPASKSLRDGSRLNQVILVRLNAEDLDEVTRARSAAGVVGYSATCTHALCPVSGWNAEKHVLRCPCHNSEYDPGRAGQVVFGPAPRPLPALPLTVTDGTLAAAGKFLGKVGQTS
jgi:rieske iron-sulfur protein